MTLREEIQKGIIEANGDTEKAAIAVCRLMEDTIGLNGNGWFDDDPQMQELLRTRK